jgi:hypothetical protein
LHDGHEPVPPATPFLHFEHQIVPHFSHLYFATPLFWQLGQGLSPEIVGMPSASAAESVVVDVIRTASPGP